MTLRFSTATLEAEIAAIERKLREITARERYPDFDKLPKMNSEERRKFKRALLREWQPAQRTTGTASRRREDGA